MYLVEYTKIHGKGLENYCSGFYSLLDAYDFALKLNMCANIESVLVSQIDTSFSDVLYRNDYVQECPDNESMFKEKFQCYQKITE